MNLKQQLKIKDLENNGVQVVKINGLTKVSVPLRLDNTEVKKDLFKAGFMVATKGREGSSFIYYIKWS